MFFIFNKQKIYSYLIAASTVAILFVLSFFFTSTDLDSVETSSNTISSNELNELYKKEHNVDTNNIQNE